MAKKQKQGGVRKGAGRKPVADPKIQISLYVEESTIKKFGGIEELRNECYAFLKEKTNK